MDLKLGGLIAPSPPLTYEPKKKVIYLYNMFARSSFTSFDMYVMPKYIISSHKAINRGVPGTLSPLYFCM
jgi:hypothetical protein